MDIDDVRVEAIKQATRLVVEGNVHSTYLFIQAKAIENYILTGETQ